MVKGWEGYGLLYDVEFYKAVTLKDAEEELKGLGIEPDEVSSGRRPRTRKARPYGE